MSSLPVSAVLATWLDAARAGQVEPRRPRRRRARGRPRHLVTGLPERDVLELHELPAAVTGRVSLALPAPGDLVGLGGPASFNTAATDAGEAVVAGAFGLVPRGGRAHGRVACLPGGPAPWVDERESAAELKLALADVDAQAGRPRRRRVAAGHPRPAAQPAAPGAVAPPPWVRRPPGGDRRARRALPGHHRPGPLGRRRSGDGVRDAAPAAPPSDDLARATRRALVGACSSRGGVRPDSLGTCWRRRRRRRGHC